MAGGKAWPLSLGLLAACRLVNYGSNLPDGGPCPAVDGGGSGALTGNGAFPVLSARESLLADQSAVYDGGRFVGWDDAGSSYIRVTLLGPPVACPVGDGGCAEAVEVYLGSPADAGSWNGAYPLGDGGTALLGLGQVDALGTAWLASLAAAGQIQITATQDCSLAGSFSAWLVAPAGDAGADGGWSWSDAGTLAGSFQALYAP